MNNENNKIRISVVVPLFNEEGSLKQLYAELIPALEPFKNYEIIFINDGSRDNSKSILDELHLTNKECVKVIHFKNNFGKAAALQAGFDIATGEIIITLDADLQDDPKEIPRFIQKINEGYDVVSGRKFHRLDSFIKNNTSKIYNHITSLVSGIWLHDHNCGFKAYKSNALKGIKLYGQLHRYIPVLIAVNGFERITEININHRKRIFGETKYNWTRFFWGIVGLLHVIIITNGKAIYLVRKLIKLNLLNMKNNKMKNITIIGTGYVGLVTGVCLADLGNKVFCVDIDEKRIKNLNKSVISFFEPDLDKIVKSNLKKRKLFFSTDISAVMIQSEIVFITVGTPPKENGEADLSFIEKVAEDIGKNLQNYKVIVIKSTVPPGTCRKIKDIIKKYSQVNFDIISNPEFLREGSAVVDFMKPDRIVVGLESEKAKNIMNNLYKTLKAPILFTSIESSEMIKYASNAFLATKISFINEIANVCEIVGADVEEIAKGMGLDPRIGSGFLKAGIGYGGSCFPKDVHALHQSAGINGYDFRLLKSVIEVNNNQRKLIVNKTEKMLGSLKNKRIAVWGLAFKANTDDIRESAAVEIIEILLGKGAKVKVYDPIAMENAKKTMSGEIVFCENSYEAVQGSDVLLIVTEWDEFKKPNFLKIKKLLKQPNVIDGKNIYNPIKMKKMGFNYLSVGR